MATRAVSFSARLRCGRRWPRRRATGGGVLCGYFTGLRLRDVAELRWEAVDFAAGVLRVKPKKTREAMVLLLHDELAGWLRGQPRGIAKAPLFPTLAGKGTGGGMASAGASRP